jgi:hypothetical protein
MDEHETENGMEPAAEKRVYAPRTIEVRILRGHQPGAGKPKLAKGQTHTLPAKLAKYLIGISAAVRTEG